MNTIPTHCMRLYALVSDTHHHRLRELSPPRRSYAVGHFAAGGADYWAVLLVALVRRETDAHVNRLGGRADPNLVVQGEASRLE